MPLPHAKNWSDRADRDLFFTILSCKNIGIITGAEWTAIGNNMRTLGYGFTNEGCRQHFQGLRRTVTGKKRAYAAAAGEADVPPVPVQRAASTATFGVASADTLFGTPSQSLPHGVDPRRNPIARRRARAKNGVGGDVGSVGVGVVVGGSVNGSDGNVLYGVIGVNANGANRINGINGIREDAESSTEQATANGPRLLPASDSVNSVIVEEISRAESTPYRQRRREDEQPQTQIHPQTQTAVPPSAADPTVPVSSGIDGVYDDQDTDVDADADDGANGQQNKRQRLYEAFPVLSTPTAVPLPAVPHPPIHRPRLEAVNVDEVGDGDATDVASCPE